MANSYGIIGLEHAHVVDPRGTMDLVPQFDADTMNILEAQAALIEQGVIVVKRGAASLRRTARRPLPQADGPGERFRAR